MSASIWSPGTPTADLNIEFLSLAAFGAIGDGLTDDTDEVQAALTACAGKTLHGVPGKNYLIGPITIPDDTTFDLQSSTLTANGAIAQSTQMILVGNRVTIRNGKIDCANTNGATTVNADGAYYGILFEDKTGLRVLGVEFTNYRYPVVMSTRTGLACTDMLVQGCFFNGTIWPHSNPDSLPYAIFVGNATNPTNTTIGTFDTNWEEALLVSGARIVGNRIIGGQYGIALQRCSNVTVVGNTITECSRGVSAQHQCRDLTITANGVKDCHSTGIHTAYGTRNTVISGNVITGTMTNDATGIQAYYGVQDVVIANNVLDSQFDQWAGGTHLETLSMASSNGIRVGQMARNVRISGNQIRGYARGIMAYTTIYPATILPGDPNYQKAGLKGIEIRDNKVVYDYEVLVATGYRGQNLASNSYDIWVSKSAAWEDSTAGAWGLDDVVVEQNKCYDAQYSLVWQYVADTSGNPAAKTKLIARDNVAVSGIGTQAAVYAGSIAGTDVRSRNNSWADSSYEDWTTFTPVPTGLTVVNGTGGATYSGKYLRRGNTIWFHIYVNVTGTCTTQATVGATYFTVDGMAPAEIGTCWAANAATGVSYGTGVVRTVSPAAVAPTWPAVNSNVVLSGFFRL